MGKRNKNADMMKGLLIICVVVGHSCEGIIHDFVFLFHMPVFFIISGLFLSKDNCSEQGIRKRTVVLMIPCIMYGIIDCLVFRHNFVDILRLIWGGRYFPGVYWYVTCFLAALILFAFLQKHFSDRTTKLLIVSGGGIAVIESHLAEHVHILQSPGIPWNMDVALLALVYLAIGFYYKVPIKKWLEDDNRKFDIIALIISVLLVAFCVFNYWGGRRLYYFDMKPLYYKELFSAILIPCAFGVVLCRIVFWIERVQPLSWLERAFAFLGRMTLPIMFMHVPLNTWKVQFGYDGAWYGRSVYVAIGIGVPVIFTLAFHRFRIMRKLFGLPNLSKVETGRDTESVVGNKPGGLQG